MRQYFQAWILYTIGLLVAVPAVALHVSIDSSLSDLARMLEGPGLHLALAALFLSLLMIILGFIRLGALGFAASLAGVLHIYLVIPQIPAPKIDQGHDLSLLVTNIEGTWGTNHEAVFDNILEADADVIFIMETAPKLRTLLSDSGRYPHHLPCPPSRCDNDVFSKYPLVWGNRLNLSYTWRSPRSAAMKLALSEESELTLFLAHLTKAWIPGSKAERNKFLYRIQAHKGPLVVAGDFNAAPWSAQMRHLKSKSAVHFKNLPPATWPSEFGAFGIPIDHVGVKGDVELLSLTPWLGASQSNHRGLLAKLRVKSLTDKK